MTGADGFLAECRAGGGRIIVAALVGVGLGLSALPFYTLGVFAQPLSQAFHWPRALVQSGIIFSMLGTVCVAGLAGWLIDRIGVRRVALTSQLGLAAGFCLLAAQNGSPTLWHASWFLLAVLGIGTTPLTWSRGIAEWFVQARGTALGIALAGTGVTAFAAPPLIGMLIASQGWRIAYLAIAAAIVLIGMPTVWFLFHGKRGYDGQVRTSGQSVDGLSFGTALRGYRFWLLILAFAAISFGIGGAIPNLVPLLIDQGIAHAALYASLLGLNVILGRLVAGYLLDRIWAPAVGAVLLSLPAIACLLLAQHKAPAIAAGLIGLAGGAEFDLISFLCARYFGLRHYGQIYAWQWASFSLAAGAGAVSFARAFDRTGSYATALYLAAVALLAGGLSLLALGRYPRPPASSGA